VVDRAGGGGQQQREHQPAPELELVGHGHLGGGLFDRTDDHGGQAGVGRYELGGHRRDQQIRDRGPGIGGPVLGRGLADVLFGRFAFVANDGERGERGDGHGANLLRQVQRNQYPELIKIIDRSIGRSFGT
jgi:hypothetical protein